MRRPVWRYLGVRYLVACAVTDGAFMGRAGIAPFAKEQAGGVAFYLIYRAAYAAGRVAAWLTF